MKKKALMTLMVCILLSGIAACSTSDGKQPYQDLDASQILSATVRLEPPGKTLPVADIDELTEYLQDVVIYDKDDSYESYDGLSVTYTLTMTDGTQTEIMPYEPCIVIDGIGYRTEHDSCYILSNYAARLLNDENAVTILKEPPALAVRSGQVISALLGTYSWEYQNDDGINTHIEADSVHPLDCEDLLTSQWTDYETTENTAALYFNVEPDEILYVRCWNDEHWSDPGADSEDVVVNGNEIELKPGGYIYEVKARWDTESGYGGGNAYYSFYVKTAE